MVWFHISMVHFSWVSLLALAVPAFWGSGFQTSYLYYVFYLAARVSVVSRGIFCHGTEALECTGSIVVAHGLSYSATCGILVPWLGIEPISPALQGGFFFLCVWKIHFLFLTAVDLQYYTSFRCTAQWFSILQIILYQMLLYNDGYVFIWYNINLLLFYK